MGDAFLNKKPEAEECEYVYAEDSTGAIVRVKKNSIAAMLSAVQYAEQELTGEQQTQARDNIGAASEAEKISMSYDEENKIVRFFRGGGNGA